MLVNAYYIDTNCSKNNIRPSCSRRILILKRLHSRHLVITAVVLGCACLPLTVAAQDADSNEANGAGVLEEIIVTATRRDQRLQSVPLSVHVLTEKELRRLGAVGFADFARSVPGLSFTDGGTGGEKQTIRGISVNPWVEVNPGTAVHLDEVPVTGAGGTTGPPFNPDPVLIDINRIEVLRGPQGTLFGAGSMGGAIRIITNQPDPDEFEAEVNTTLTSTQDGEFGYRLAGVVNMPFNDGRAALRAVAFQSDLGGFIDNTFDGRSNVNNRELSGGRLTGKLLISDTTSLTARIAYQDRASGGLTHEEPAVGKRQQNRIRESIDDEWVNYNVVLDVDFDWGSLISSTSYLDRTVDTVADVSFFLRLFFGLDQPLNVVNKEVINEFIQEVRLVSDTDNRLSWLIGAFYQNQDQDTNQDFPSPGFDALTGGLASMFGPPDNLFVRRENFSLEQIALYGEASYQLTDNLELTAGGRWYDIDRKYTADNMGLLFVMGQVQESFSAGDRGVIPKLGLNYTANERVSIYGIVAAGFRPGGINPPGAIMDPSCAMELLALGYTSTPTSYESDSLVNYEVGSRFITATGRTRLNSSVYYIDWSDMQTAKFLNCGTGFFENAGRAESYGVELELLSRPTDAFEYDVAASYNVAELSEDVPNLGGVKGDRLPGVPRLTISAGVRFFFTTIGNMNPSIGADAQYVGKSYMGFNSTMSRELPAYTVANLRFGLQSKTWSATLFAHNVFDETGTLFINDNVLGEWVTQIRPRTVGVSLNWQF